MTLTKMTTIKNQAHPLWSEPDCIRFPCHVSPELLVTSAVDYYYRPPVCPCQMAGKRLLRHKGVHQSGDKESQQDVW